MAAEYARITALLREKRLTVTTMESCTGGLIASLLTDTPGASETIPGAFVTYSNGAKVRCGVPAAVLEQYGVYSAETASAMAEAAMAAYGTDLAIGITGSLGRADPANGDSVPGQVWCALRCGGETEVLFWDDIAAPDRQGCKALIAARVAAALLEILAP